MELFKFYIIKLDFKIETQFLNLAIAGTVFLPHAQIL